MDAALRRALERMDAGASWTQVRCRLARLALALGSSPVAELAS